MSFPKPDIDVSRRLAGRTTGPAADATVAELSLESLMR